MSRSHDARLRDRREVIRLREKQQKMGYTFPLSATFRGEPEDSWLKARVTCLSLRDKESIAKLPTHLQDAVNRGLSEMEKFQRRMQESGNNDPATLLDRAKNNEHVLAAARAYCLATFIDPPLVENEADLDNPDYDRPWLVDDVHADDQFAIFLGNIDSDSTAAKKFRLYRPESVIDVDPTPATPAAPASTPEPEPTDAASDWVPTRSIAA